MNFVPKQNNDHECPDEEERTRLKQLMNLKQELQQDGTNVNDSKISPYPLALNSGKTTFSYTYKNWTFIHQLHSEET